jgi:hypothetical protein
MTAHQRSMQERIPAAAVKFERDFNAATTDAERLAARHEYEREITDAVHGVRLTSAEYVASLKAAR